MTRLKRFIKHLVLYSVNAGLNLVMHMNMKIGKVERKINPLTQEEYDLHTDEYTDCIKKTYNENIAQKYIKEYLAK
ncbi:hypothetical protein RhiirC2_776995 [Rhizophagus irregularis]|uniref:Uncharacterized protein n=1 Tax=Rhizophagus irregularis TaxID=588596 RepID=A0A2N1NFE4_9GLOM|nr:hypothetical protein RhiirC2_776995 [Rhizophagus irregularis]